MQREIKFRVWGRALKPPHFLTEQDLKTFTSNNWWETLNGTFGIFQNDLFIIQQFTGLKDKNGTEIYEGDILCWSPEVGGIPAPSKNSIPFKPEVVFWDTGETRFKIKSLNSDEHLRWYAENGKIIGHIFKHPLTFL